MTPETNLTRDAHIQVKDGDQFMVADEGDDKVEHQILLQKIRNQIEFYLGDSNLVKDNFLRLKLDKDPQIELSLFLGFNRVKALLTIDGRNDGGVKMQDKEN